ncbi:hypothetical protein MY04_4646 [Flammeovirga sp. MY04]|uniref:hypothetical protein n=1 Tax=Flammeovirga sp. MY04 TaxID=1191459 RepID=UPI00080632E4|nr:hypothetical protein [Flammeovirga sp. MY04]ANQ51981.1 hypothetical protein MY04_4646 [Flammeovirga sp. MY04]
MMLLDNKITENINTFSDWRLYPTLVQKTTTIYPPSDNKIYKVEIYSVKENMLFYKSVHNANAKISCEDWPEGIYKIFITQGKVCFTLRFLIHDNKS